MRVDVGVPFPAVLDLGALRDGVAGLRARAAVQAEVRLTVPEGWSVRIDGDFSVLVGELALRWTGRKGGSGMEGAAEERRRGC